MKGKKKDRYSGPSNIRCADLIKQMDDEHVVLGPVDRDDIKAGLEELIELRVERAAAAQPVTEEVAA